MCRCCRGNFRLEPDRARINPDFINSTPFWHWTEPFWRLFLSLLPITDQTRLLPRECQMAEAPTINETLTPDDAGMMVEELLEAQNHTLTLGRVLNVTSRDVKAIQATYQQPKERLFHIVIAFLRQETLTTS
ncbi:hypothetical protein GBAR_LOCUS12033 [Geodia barretti]|uniref:Uncharacterized protein n=1 Tax=Geodia barretti TaxID=519541 RepID=A0AA35WGX6_GEOBA|nr:hypothetical protein GBAR_LOCUS12033 [Geodia barretti]